MRRWPRAKKYIRRCIESFEVGRVKIVQIRYWAIRADGDGLPVSNGIVEMQCVDTACFVEQNNGHDPGLTTIRRGIDPFRFAGQLDHTVAVFT